ncbi:ABC transporter ATP-binding protein [Paenibacillus polymyxa]|uniref:ABC transporter ATP-binding protein n=1 Tax=Paenibacillus polymyxa TaxID=1406 RepID=UPI002AB54B26|nr:ABC transporter ATP-binding protein [Paenibacillus polymyxa]MDY8116770.1 ABC transporter ATP-binding protein [Paenibacillus polymyxa]
MKWYGLILIIFCSVARSIIKALTSYQLGTAIDALSVQELISAVTHLVIAIVLPFGGSILMAVENRSIGVTMESLFLSIRLRSFTTIAEADVSYLERETRLGDISSRLNSDLENLNSVLSGQFTWLFTVLIQMAVSVGFCMLVSWQLSIAYFLILPISIWGIQKISKPISRYQTKASERTGASMNVAVDMLSNILVVKSFHAYDEMNARYAKEVNRAYKETTRSNKIVSILTALKLVVSIMQIGALFYFSLYYLKKEIITVGDIVVFISLSTYVREGFGLIDYVARALRSASSLAERVIQVIDIPGEKSGNDNKKYFTKPLVSLQNVSFGYDTMQEVLKGISIQVRDKQKVGLIGHSGSGKSTVLKLISRFYMQTKGEIEFYGKPSECWDLCALRKNFAIVPQEPFLFQGTIFDNIAYGNVNCSEADVIRAAKDAGLWDFVSGLSDGLYTHVGDYGAQLSGGQKQRICIARAMLKNAQLILLDEVTSALDTKAEEVVKKSLDKLLANRAAIIVAHKLSTIQDVDYLYCFANGVVIEHGTPKKLLSQKGYYYQICIKQGLISEENTI